MSVPVALRVLLVDNQPDMACSVAQALQQGGFDPHWRRVETEQEYLQSLDAGLDVIVAADTLPQLDALRALHILQQCDLDSPFIVLTSEAGEEVALACLRHGAADYLFRDRLGRLGAAVERALAARRLRQEKRQAETVSRLREARFRATFEQAAVGIAHVALDGRYLRVNRKLCEILGYTREELLRLRFQDVTYPDDMEASMLHAHRLAAREIAMYTLEKRYVRKCGSPIWINLTASLVDEAAGAPPYFLAVIEDITERRRLGTRTREALDTLLSMAEALVEVPEAAEGPGQEESAAGIVGHRLAELTRSVLACRHVAIIAVEPESELLHPIAVTGFSTEDEPRWWGQWESHPRLSDRLDPPHVAQLRTEGVLLLDRTRPPFKRETALGRRIVLMVPLRRGDTITGVLSVDHGDQEHDYTPDEIALIRAVGRLAALVIERERLLHEREEARAGELALREANRRMDEFLSIASHELRTPLTTILGMTQLARRRAQSLASRADVPAAVEADAIDAIDRLLARAEYQARRLSHLVHDLLDVSRIQADHLELRLASCDLGAVVAEAVDEQRQSWPERTIALTTLTTPVYVTADGDRLGQVVTNYLTNALKYSPIERPIEVTVDRRDGEARVGVRDEGPGLTLEQQRFIWDRFHRVRGIAVHADGGDNGGLGLGLYISRTIVERHGGRVGVDSTPGVGSTFWFTLPPTPPDERP